MLKGSILETPKNKERLIMLNASRMYCLSTISKIVPIESILETLYNAQGTHCGNINNA